MQFLAIYYLLRYSRGLPRTSALRKSSPNCRAQYKLLTEKERVSFPYWEDHRTENLHTRNTLVIVFSYAAVGLYGIPYFSILPTVS